jgi:hypothetical protein
MLLKGGWANSVKRRLCVIADFDEQAANLQPTAASASCAAAAEEYRVLYASARVTDIWIALRAATSPLVFREHPHLDGKENLQWSVSGHGTLRAVVEDIGQFGGILRNLETLLCASLP